MAEFHHLRILDISLIECVGETPMITETYQEFTNGISTLGELTELRLPSQITIDHIPERVRFQNLKVLHTHSDPFAVARFINTISSNNLHTIIGDFWEQTVLDATSMQPLIDALRRHELSLRIMHIISLDANLSQAFASELRHLEDVKLHSSAVVFVHDAHTMASAWRNLKSLDLADRRTTFVT